MKFKWLVGGLAASLTLNLALIGFLIGTAFDPPSWGRRGLDATDGLARLVLFLGEERRRELLDRQTRQEIGASLQEMRRAQRALGKALTAEPFRREAVAAALAQFREQLAANQVLSHAAFADMAAQLTPEERRRFVRQRFARRDGWREDARPRER